MEWKRKLHVVAWWTSGQSGLAKSDSAFGTVRFALRDHLPGNEGQWTPEELFLGALASSITTTFHALAGSAGLEYTDLEIDAEAIFEKGTADTADHVDSFGALVVRPRLTVTRPEDREPAFHLLQKVRMLCPISRALASAPRFETDVEVSKLTYVR